MKSGVYKLNRKTQMLLLSSIAFVVAPHVLHLPIWVTLTVLGVGVWKWYAQQHAWPMPNALIRMGVTTACVIGIFISYGIPFGRDPGVALLIIMVTLKLLELRRHRDALLTVFLCYFLVITNFLYSQSMAMAVYMVSVVWLITLTLIVLSHPGKRLPLLNAGKLATTLLVQSVPLVIILFILVPRIPNPFWGISSGSAAGSTGMSDQMSPGSVSNLIRSEEVAFRVKFKDQLPQPHNRYWRGPVLWQYDGKTWSPGPPSTSNQNVQVHALGPPIEYEVTLEPHDNRWLFALDMAGSVPAIGQVTPDFQLLANKPVKNTIRYALKSYPQYRIGTLLSAKQRHRALQIPPRLNPKTRQLAASWHAKGLSDSEIIMQALTMFRTEPFIYTLQPPVLGTNAVDDFLFNTRRGFCEHYASAMAFLMRAAGIPTRIITGYQGGELNPLGEYMLVRQSDAHAWVEIWQPGEGWQRVDPTGAVAPERVEIGIDAAIPAEERLQSMLGTNNAYMHSLHLLWDGINFQWNQWVVGYDFKRQQRFLSALGFDNISWQELAIGLFIGLGMVILFIAIFIIHRQTLHMEDPVVKKYLKFCAKLARIGITRHANEGPVAFACRVESQRPDLAPQVRLITDLYVGLRYQSEPPKTFTEKFTKLVTQFNPRQPKRRNKRRF
jgi:transglutaminase-like putative cysteine protease